MDDHDEVDHDELIQNFMTFTGVDSERAKFFLESAAWDSNMAFASFYEEPEDEPAASASGPASASGSASSNSEGEASGSKKPQISFTPNEDSEDNSSDDDDGQTFYAGGSRTSGQQIVGPGKKKKDVVGRLMKAAKAQGAEVVGEDSRGKKSPRKTFKGTSYRLGETPDDTQVIPDEAHEDEEEATTVTLSLYLNGFTVDNGPLRLYTQPENIMFIQQIKNGQIPLELLKTHKKREISITMKDLREQKYSPPKKSLQAFSGAGHSLGSPAPAVVGQVPYLPGPGGSAAPANPSACEDQAKSALNVDSTQPTTNVQVRLSDGSRLVVRANQNHTIQDLRTYITTARPPLNQGNMILMNTFPHTELSDPTQTLKQANLLNAAIVVKFK